jgi:hypothetical protein
MRRDGPVGNRLLRSCGSSRNVTLRTYIQGPAHSGRPVGGIALTLTAGTVHDYRMIAVDPSLKFENRAGLQSLACPRVKSTRFGDLILVKRLIIKIISLIVASHSSNAYLSRGCQTLIFELFIGNDAAYLNLGFT